MSAPIPDSTHRVEFHRNVFALVPGHDGHETILVAPVTTGETPRQFCSCSRGRRPACSHAGDLRRAWVDLTSVFGEVTPWDALATGPAYAALRTLISRDTRGPEKVTARTDTGTDGAASVTLLSGADRTLARYRSPGPDAARLAERVDRGDGANRATRGRLIERCSDFALTDQEQLLRDRGTRSTRQAEEASLWFRLAYHVLREFGPEVSIRTVIDEPGGELRLALGDGVREMDCFVDRDLVSPLLAALGRMPGASPMPILRGERELLFDVSAGGSATFTFVPHVDTAQPGAPPALSPFDPRRLYGDLYYVPYAGAFVRLSAASMGILARGWDRERTLAAEEAARLIDSEPATFSLTSVASGHDASGALDLFAAGSHDDLGRIRGIAVLRRFERLEMEPEEMEGDWCTVRLSYAAGAASVAVSTVMDTRDQGRRFALSTACIVDCQAPALDSLPLQGLRPADRGRVRLPRAALLQFRDEGMSVRVTGESTFSRSLAALMDITPVKPLRALRLLSSELRDYQKRGVRWLLFLYDNRLGGLLCDDMGLGKTHQTMALMCAVREQRKVPGPFLVVCPTTVISHWEALLGRFAPGLETLVYHGSGRDNTALASHRGVVVTSYGLLRNDIDKLESREFALALFDEAQCLRNAGTGLWLAASRVKAHSRICMTGTPVANALNDLKALFDLVLPGYLGTDTSFMDRFMDPIESGNDEVARSRLRRAIAPFVLRRTKEAVLGELPAKSEEDWSCGLSPEQETLYAATLAERAAPIARELRDPSRPVPYIHVFAVLNRLKMICDHPCLPLGTPANYASHGSAKFDLLCELLEECLGSDRKVVVYSQYLDMIDIIARHVATLGIEPLALTGSSRNRGAIVRGFNTDPTRKVLVASLKAGGQGIDLTAASVVIHYDRWWNAAAEDQATDRVHRMGQTRGVLVYRLIAAGTVEERIAAIVARKRELAAKTLTEDSPEAVKGFTREELLALLGEGR